MSLPTSAVTYDDRSKKEGVTETISAAGSTFKVEGSIVVGSLIEGSLIEDSLIEGFFIEDNIVDSLIEGSLIEGFLIEDNVVDSLIEGSFRSNANAMVGVALSNNTVLVVTRVLFGTKVSFEAKVLSSDDDESLSSLVKK